MASVNKVIIVGNLGADPEKREFPNSGGSVTNLRVATTERYKDREGNMQENTEWHRISLFNKLGEIAAQYLRKGSSVYIEGRIRTRKYQKDGNDVYATEIVADQMQMLGGRSGGGGGAGMGGGDDGGYGGGNGGGGGGYGGGGGGRSSGGGSDGGFSREPVGNGNGGGRSGGGSAGGGARSGGSGGGYNSPNPGFDADDDIPF